MSASTISFRFCVFLFLFFTQADILEKVGPDALKLGLLMGTEDDSREEEQQEVLSFHHLLIMEFVAAKYISTLTDVSVAVVEGLCIVMVEVFANISAKGCNPHFTSHVPIVNTELLLHNNNLHHAPVHRWHEDLYLWTQHAICLCCHSGVNSCAHAYRRMLFANPFLLWGHFGILQPWCSCALANLANWGSVHCVWTNEIQPESSLVSVWAEEALRNNWCCGETPRGSQVCSWTFWDCCTFPVWESLSSNITIATQKVCGSVWKGWTLSTRLVRKDTACWGAEPEKHLFERSWDTEPH